MKLFIAFFSIFSIISSLTAQLKFEATISSKKATATMHTISFSFPFENTSSSTIKITDIKTTCGCTVAESSKQAYGAGERGAISGVYTIGDAQTGGAKQITVSTDCPAQPFITLSVSVEVERLYALRPGLLFWRKDAPAEEKTIRLELSKVGGYRVGSVKSESVAFSVKLEPIKDEPNNFFIRVKPEGMEKESRSRITIELEGEGRPSKVISAYALIK